MSSSLRTPRCFAIAGALLAGCGGDHRDTPIDAPPAPPVDAITVPDAPPVDAPSRVSVTVLTDLGDGLPDTSARVIFADDANRLVQQGLVGAEGTASADMPLGGIVHVLHATDGTAHDRTVRLTSIRVRPGDSVTFGVAVSKPVGEPIKLQGTFVPLPGQVSSYAFYHRCGGGFTEAVEGNVAHLTAVANCLPAMFDVLGTTVTSASSGVLPHFVWFTATPAGGFTAPDLLRMPDFTANVSHVPVGSTVEVQRITMLPPYFADADIRTVTINGAATTVAAKLPYPPAPSTVSAIAVVETRVSPSSFDRQLQVIRTRVGATAASLDVDVAAGALPVVKTVPMLSGKTVSWTQTGTGTPDLREVMTSSAYSAGGLTYAVFWTVLDGESNSSLELPGLPAMFADFDPTQQPAATSGDGSVVYVDYSNVKGFDAARTLPLGSLTGHGGRFGAGLFEDQLYSMQASMH